MTSGRSVVTRRGPSCRHVGKLAEKGWLCCTRDGWSIRFALGVTYLATFMQSGMFR